MAGRMDGSTGDSAAEVVLVLAAQREVAERHEQAAEAVARLAQQQIAVVRVDLDQVVAQGRRDRPLAGQTVVENQGTVEVGQPRAEQYKEARYRMLGRQFSDYESEIRGHLGGMLSSKHFNFDRDVASLTVNRWAHGYTVAGPGDSVAIGRQPHGRITIANSDSAPAADAIEAMRMGYRAVSEIKT